MSRIDLYKSEDLVFGITQKLLDITTSNLVRWYITNKGIFFNLFRNQKSNRSLVPDAFFLITLSIKRYWVRKKKIKLTFLRFFDNPLSKHLIFKKNSLHAMVVLVCLAKLKRDLGLAFGTHFLHYFSIKMFCI